MDIETWNQNKDRPAFVRRHREELTEAAGLADLDEQIPRDLAAVEDWLHRYKGTVTRRLSSADAETDDDAQTDDQNGGDE